MKTDKPISRSTLDETPNRVLTFLRAAGTSGPIRRALAARGYTEKEHADGWDLLHKCSSYRAPVPTVGRTAAIDAIRELDAMDEAELFPPSFCLGVRRAGFFFSRGPAKGSWTVH